MDDLFHHTATGSMRLVPNFRFCILAKWSFERVIETLEPTDGCILCRHATIGFDRCF
jgi:hypothetical protein